MFVVCGGQRSTSGVILKNSFFKTENLNGLKLTKQARLAGSSLHLPNAGITSMCHGIGDMVESISLMDWAYNQNVRMFGKRQNPVHYWGGNIK